MKKIEKYEIPEWMECFPFPPDKKKPFKVTKDKELYVLGSLIFTLMIP